MMKYNILTEISREVPPQFHGTGGFIFTAYNCGVFEKELSDERFEYVAENLSSGKRIVLERRKNAITTRTIENLLYKLRDCKISGPSKFAVTNKPPMHLSKLEYILKTIFHEILPEYGYTIRAGQIKLAEQLLNSITRRQVLVAEAAVGLGKTMVYMIVGALIKRSGINKSWSGSYYPGMSTVEWERMPILISTSSIALQKSVLNSIYEISEILMENNIIQTPLRVSLRKGRTNYVCEYNLRSYLPFEKDSTLSAILNRISKGTIIDLADIKGLTNYVKKKIAVPLRCYENCPHKNCCQYLSFRDEAQIKEVDFVVTNHNLLLMDAKLRAEGKNGVLPPVQMVVVDEAHQLPLAARSIYGGELSVESIYSIADGLLELNFTPDNKNLFKNWRDSRDAIQILSNELYVENMNLFSSQSFDDNCEKLLKQMGATAEYLHKVLKECHPLKVTRDDREKSKLIHELKRLIETIAVLSNSAEQLRWFNIDSQTNENTELCSQPKHLSKYIDEDLWQRGIPTFLTSGTLSASGDFSAFNRSVGLNKNRRVSEVVHPSPYDYNKNSLLYISENMPLPNQSSKAYIEALADEIEQLILAAHGHTAILFTSYNVMGKVHSILEKRNIPFPFFKLEKSSSSAIEDFKKSGNGVLFASGALWEGIDIPGDALSMLIIVKLPFAVPDRVSEYEQTQYPNFYEYLNSVILPEMLVKLKQGYGRLIRAENDTGVVAILDSRINSKGAYRVPVISALPNSQITSDIKVVKKFYKLRKALSYFKQLICA